MQSGVGAATVILKAHRFLSGLTPRRGAANLDVMNESLGLTSHNLSCNCTGCGMLRAGVCINCAEKAAALILESGPGEVAVEPLFEELSLMGITAGSLFPGIDGACDQLRD